LQRVGSIESRLIKEESSWLTVSQSAAYLKMSVRSVRRYLDRGTIPRYGFQGTVRILKKDLDSLLFFGKPWKKLIARQREQLKARDP